MTNKRIIAGLIGLAMCVWLLSGEMGGNSVTADEVQVDAAAKTPLVRGVVSRGILRQQLLAVRGQTQANRVVQVKAEVEGRVTALPAIKGTPVKAGDLLCQIAVDTRESELAEARAQLKSAQFEYDGVLDLKQRGLQSEINVAKSFATLESSRARVERAALALNKTRILAPFDGVVDNQPVEIGDYLTKGQVCVSVLEVDPMLVIGQVAEKSVGKVSLGDPVTVTLITGETYTGEVSFIGRTPDAATRTFPLEVRVAHPGDQFRSGLTAEMQVPTGAEMAHLISPASLVLNDAGKVGVRVVDDADIVQFKLVTIVDEEPQGVWVKGLPAEARLITVGQEEVFEGQQVAIDLAPLSDLAAH